MAITHLGRRTTFCKLVLGIFENPWNFFALMSLTDQEVYEWLRMQDLIATNISCTSPDCNGEMFLRGAANKTGGAVFICNIDRTHTQKT